MVARVKVVTSVKVVKQKRMLRLGEYRRLLKMGSASLLVQSRHQRPRGAFHGAQLLIRLVQLFAQNLQLCIGFRKLLIGVIEAIRQRAQTSRRDQRQTEQNEPFHASRIGYSGFDGSINYGDCSNADLTDT
jgi:hypothetical protein